MRCEECLGSWGPDSYEDAVGSYELLCGVICVIADY